MIDLLISVLIFSMSVPLSIFLGYLFLSMTVSNYSPEKEQDRWKGDRHGMTFSVDKHNMSSNGRGKTSVYLETTSASVARTLNPLCIEISSLLNK